MPPILANAYVGVATVDRDAKESARGMGMSGSQVLRRVEIPLALPLIAAGIRTSALQVVATATLAGYAGSGTLGQIVFRGFNINLNYLVVGGAILVAALALVTEVLLGTAAAGGHARRAAGRRPRGRPGREHAGHAREPGAPWRPDAARSPPGHDELPAAPPAALDRRASGDSAPPGHALARVEAGHRRRDPSPCAGRDTPSDSSRRPPPSPSA